LNVTGYAKNCNDGTVQGEAQGDASAIDKFLQHLKMGPSAADVNKVDHKEMATKENENGFDRPVSRTYSHTMCIDAFVGGELL
jgi:acylphosphatase